MTSEEKQVRNRERDREYLREWRAKHGPKMGELKPASSTETGFAGCRDCKTCKKLGCRHNHNVA